MVVHLFMGGRPRYIMHSKEISMSNTTMPKTDSVTFDEITTFLKKKHRIDIYDVAKSDKHFDAWRKSRGYGTVDPDGVHYDSSQRWFAEYALAEDGQKACPSYLNFWHWLIKYTQFTKMCVTSESEHRLDCTLDTYTCEADWAEPILEKIRAQYGQLVHLRLTVDR